MCSSKEIIMQELSNKIGELLPDLYEPFFVAEDKLGRLYYEYDLVEKYVDDFAMEGWDIGLRVTYIGNDDSDDVSISYYSDGDLLTKKELIEVYNYLLEKHKNINVESRN